MHKHPHNGIPQDTPYCYEWDSKKPCRYYRTRKCGKVDNGYYAGYCKLLKKYLSIDDQVKDCGIGECEDE